MATLSSPNPTRNNDNAIAALQKDISILRDRNTLIEGKLNHLEFHQRSIFEFCAPYTLPDNLKFKDEKIAALENQYQSLLKSIGVLTLSVDNLNRSVQQISTAILQLQTNVSTYLPTNTEPDHAQEINY